MSSTADAVARPAPGAASGRRLGKRIKNSIIYLLVRALALPLAQLPAGAAVALGGLLGRLALWLAPRERRRALDNLARALPGLTVAERERVARCSARQLGRSALECLVLGRLRARLGGPRSPVRFEAGARETLARARAAGRGILFATAHHGNWELMGAAVARELGTALPAVYPGGVNPPRRFDLGTALTTVPPGGVNPPGPRELPAPVGVLFRPSYDPRFTRWMERLRAESGLRTIRVDRPGHFAEAAALLRGGGLLGVMVDLPDARERRSVTPVAFLGGVLRPSPLLPLLARRTGAAVVVGTIRRCSEDPCHHAISIQLLESVPPERLLEQAGAALSQAILEDPSQWTWSLKLEPEPREPPGLMSSTI